MIHYSINELESLTGIKAHTIRIWEKRYGLLKPERTDTNIRHYSNDELRKLINVTTLYNGGMKISHIVNLSDQEVNNKIGELISTSQTEQTVLYEAYIGKLITASLNFDEVSFEKNFSNAILRYGLVNTYQLILLPMLQRIGILWTTEKMNPGQEHFISCLILQKLYSAIDGIQPTAESKEKWLLFLPQHEFHEIGLLLANYLLRNAGKKVIYLGSRVPYDSLLQTVQFNKPTHLMLIIVHNQPVEELQEYLDKLAKDFKDLKIVIAGNPTLLSQTSIKKPIRLINNFEEFVKEI
jgi:MerR family transcriptional regulator, light-induced transcriptional regulator